MVRPSAAEALHQLQGESVSDIVGAASARRARSQGLLALGVVAAALVTLTSVLLSIMFYLDSQRRYAEIIADLDNRTVLYSREIAARDSTIAELNRQLLELSNQQDGPKSLAIGVGGLSVEPCQISHNGLQVVDLESFGCAVSAAFSEDGSRIAVLNEPGVVSVFDTSGELRFATKVFDPEATLSWEAGNLVLPSANERQSFGPDGEHIPEADNVPAQVKAVYLQFAGKLARSDLVALATQLANTGWPVQGADQGGERTERAYGFNEVRYSEDGDLAAAEQLAESVTALAKGIGINATVTTAKVNGIAAGALEIWISLL